MKLLSALLAIAFLMIGANEASASGYPPRARPMPTPAPTPEESTASFPFTGRIYTDHYLFTQGPRSGTSAQNSLSVWLELASHSTEGFGYRFVAQGDGFAASLQDPEKVTFESRLREGYFSYLSSAVDVRLGQQIISWGKSDGVNPTDFFTAKNYLLLNPDEEVRRIGAPGLNFTFTPDAGTSPVSLQLVVQAYYPQTRLLIPDQIIPPGLNFQKDPLSPKPFRNNTMEGGVKLSYAEPGFDFSLSFYEGYSHLPEYLYNSTTNSIYPVNPQQAAVGADASFTSGDYVIRFESALLMPENGQSSDPWFGIDEPWHVDTVLGVERTFATDFRVQLQGILKHHLYFQPPEAYVGPNPVVTQIQQAIGRANAILLNFQQQTIPGATFRLGYASDTSNWTADFVTALYSSREFDSLLSPQVGYKPMDNLRFLLGGQFYGGGQNSPFGALRNYSTVFFEGRYLF